MAKGKQVVRSEVPNRSGFAAQPGGSPKSGTTTHWGIAIGNAEGGASARSRSRWILYTRSQIGTVIRRHPLQERGF